MGKVCLLTQFAEGKFKERHILTIRIDFVTKSIEATRVILKIWYIARQDRTITRSYYIRAEGIIFVYDSTDEDSF